MRSSFFRLAMVSSSRAARFRLLAHIHVFADFRVVIEKPLHAASGSRQALPESSGSKVSTAKSGIRPDHRAHLHRNVRGLPQMQNVVIETVLLIPQPDSLARPCRSWPAKCTQSARKTCWRHLRKRGLRGPVPSPSPACPGNTWPSSSCHRTAR